MIFKCDFIYDFFQEMQFQSKFGIMLIFQGFWKIFRLIFLSFGEGLNCQKIYIALICKDFEKWHRTGFRIVFVNCLCFGHNLQGWRMDRRDRGFPAITDLFQNVNVPLLYKYTVIVQYYGMFQVMNCPYLQLNYVKYVYTYVLTIQLACLILLFFT